MVEKIKRLAEHLFHGHPRTAAIAVDVRPLPPTAQDDDVATAVQFRSAMMESDSILVLDEEHWEATQALLAKDDLRDSQTAKFLAGHPRNFS